MKGTEGKIGRIFILRLEDGDKLPDCIEQFAFNNGVSCGHVVFVGGISKGKIVAGPHSSDQMPPEPVLLPINEAHEVLGVGLLAPGEDGRTVLHMHASLGRAKKSLTGCIRPGIYTWLVGEALIYEITGTKAIRSKDRKSGFVLLEIR